MFSSKKNYILIMNNTSINITINNWEVVLFGVDNDGQSEVMSIYDYLKWVAKLRIKECPTNSVVSE